MQYDSGVFAAVNQIYIGRIARRDSAWVLASPHKIVVSLVRDRDRRSQDLVNGEVVVAMVM